MATQRRGGLTLEEQMEQLQSREADLLESEPEDLESIREYWDVVKKIQLLLCACGRRGIRRLGGMRVPPTHVSEQEAKDAILMGMMAGALRTSPYSRENWSLQDFNPLLFRQPPEGLKRGGRSVTVVYCDDPTTETAYTYWDKVYYYDTERRVWIELRGGQDQVGLWAQTQGGQREYHTLWRDEGRKYCQTSQVTWRVGSYDSQSSQEPTEGLSPPVHESTRAWTPSPPQLTRYSGGTTGGYRSGGPTPGTSSGPPDLRSQRTPAPQTRRRRPQPSDSRRPAPKRRRVADQQGTAGPSSIAPADVGANRQIDTSRGGSRVERLLREAADPPAICYLGSTAQLKTIRHRIVNGPLAYKNVSSTWHWLGAEGPDSDSRILVTFDSAGQRQQFLDRFKASAAGVRVQIVSLIGLV
ncbi:E2 [Duck papillomavirus 3]|uniref:Regulatory protein E2 n=1 Tax=Duck papillomavirus 3 TaxID=2562546 RepID=A0AAE5YMT2_9PAPI|nr:E2 [Duck papillomavirus 3]